MDQTSALGNSAKAEPLLRPAALWAADCADSALTVFGDEERTDYRLREAIAGAREFGHGGPRNKALRTLAWAAHTAANESEQPSAKFAARSAMLAAAVAYTHTDLNLGRQGVNQARHLLGAAVYAALACELASESPAGVAERVLLAAADTMPEEVGILLKHFPPQPRGTTRLSQLFHDLDARLRLKSAV
ncbi:putative immunity protein [Paracoccus mangrovi]|uniref:Immunity protein n=1 Tax=Paracoccus mangrovi TaxID=1715645 RepID=A0ABV7R5M2_9RHOB